MIAEYRIITSLDSPTNIGKVKMTFSSNNLTIDSQKRGKITINLYNIRTIYIDSDESDSDSKSTYTVICKLKKPIKVPISKKNIKEIKLFGNFEGKKNLNTAKKLIAELKKILNLR